MKRVALLIILIIGSILLVGCSQTKCQADAKVCPDGTIVGRTGPNCEFEKCPDIDNAINNTQKVQQDDYNLALELMGDNDIPLSLLSIDQLKTDIFHVSKKIFDKTKYPDSPYREIVRVTFEQDYNGFKLPKKYPMIFYDGKLTPSDLSSDSLKSFYFPMEHRDLLFKKDIERTALFIDFNKIQLEPQITRGEADKRIKDILKSDYWSSNKFLERIISYSLELLLSDRTSSNNLGLVWKSKPYRSSGMIIIDAQTGEVLSNFNGIQTGTS